MSKKEKIKKIEFAEYQRELLGLKADLQVNRTFLKTSGWSDVEKNARIEQANFMEKKIDKFIRNKQTPVQSIETVRGTQYKLGDEFYINGNDVTAYTVVLFPSSSVVRGEAKNPQIGYPWTCECYIEDIHKKKKGKVVEEKAPKVKKVKIKVGQYFKSKNVNTVYKCVGKFDDGCVAGTNDLTMIGFNTKIKVHRSHITVVDKKEYKNQQKAEKNYKAKQNEKVSKVVPATPISKKSKKKDKKKSKKKNKKK